MLKQVGRLDEVFIERTIMLFSVERFKADIAPLEHHLLGHFGGNELWSELRSELLKPLHLPNKKDNTEIR